MTVIHRSARVPYSAEQMFDLVNDVEAYPEFLHWCRGARAERVDEHEIAATLEIGVGMLHKQFKTRNRLSRPERIRIDLISGPFRHLSGDWRFTDAADGGSTVDLDLEFEVSHGLLGAVFGAAFEELSRQQLNAFVRRAEQTYG